jgi:hypothetical protein
VNVLADQKNKIDKVEKDIEQELFDIDKKDDFTKDIKDIEDSINRINSGYKKFTGGNLIEFLSKMEFNNTNNTMTANAGKGKKLNKSKIESVLSKENLGQLVDFEKDRMGRYNDYNLIYSYIPQLAECINVFRDSIMSPDDLTKSSLNVTYGNTNANGELAKTVVRNLGKIIEKYELNNRGKNIIRKALTLGDYFVAVLKYDDEFNKMLLNEQNDELFLNKKEDTNVILESQVDIDEDVRYIAEVLSEAKDAPEATQIYANIQKDVAKVINNNIKYDDDPRSLLIASSPKDFARLNRNRQKRNKGEDGEEYTNFGFKGSILRLLEPENVVKLEVDGINFGYIYIEKTDNLVSNAQTQSAINDFFDSRVDIEKSKFKDREQVITNIFVKGISKKIDNDLIKDNKEFKDYIYTLLKEKYITDKAVKITYLTPEEVVPFIVDQDGLYGQSVLSRSLFFAKLYLATLITELMQKVSRGRDKRLVYVETGLDDDIEGVIQGVVKDIKSKEIQTDVLKSITSILNDIGVFDDYYIPLVDGEKPLDFDTLQGMDVDADNPFLQFLLRSAITGTGIPANYVDASQDVEFSRNLAMQNSTFVRSIVVHQQMFSEAFSKLLRLLYKNEYLVDENNNGIADELEEKDKKKKISDNQNVSLDDIKVTFPTPITLNLTNVNDQISNSSQTVDFITSIYFDENDMDTAKKTTFKKKVVRELLPTTIDWDKIDKIYEESQIDAMERKVNQGGSDDSSGGDGGFGGDMDF